MWSGLDTKMTSDFGRDLNRQVANLVRATQRDLDALLTRAGGLSESAIRSELAAIFSRNGMDAPSAEIDRCTAGLLAGERIKLTVD